MTVPHAMLLAGLVLATFGTGAIVGARFMTRVRLARLGFTAESARLYERASRLLSRMHTITELDGDLSADILSPRSRELIGEWLVDYRKQIERI